jgi:hypothetical protein
MVSMKINDELVHGVVVTAISCYSIENTCE